MSKTTKLAIILAYDGLMISVVALAGIGVAVNRGLDIDGLRWATLIIGILLPLSGIVIGRGIWRHIAKVWAALSVRGRIGLWLTVYGVFFLAGQIPQAIRANLLTELGWTLSVLAVVALIFGLWIALGEGAKTNQAIALTRDEHNR